VEEIASRLDDRFHLLTGGVRTALPRHQTLQAMIDWSHDLLSEPERILLRRLSVFAGGWTLEAAEFVCEGADIEKQEILDLLTQLLNKSLILAERKQAQEMRYHMLETIREYAHEKRWAAGEGETIRQRHLAYYVDLAERAEPNLRAFDMIMWLDRLETDLDNIRIALNYALESDVEAQLRLASALLWFWHIRGPRSEGTDWLERGLSIEAAERGDQPLTASRATIRGKALNTSGMLMTMFFNIGKASDRFEESLPLYQKLGSAGKQGLAYALWGLAGATQSTNRPVRRLLEQSLTLFREVSDKFGAAQCLMSLSVLILEENNDYRQAVNFAEEQLALRRQIGDQDGIAIALVNLRDLAFERGDYEQAMALHEESLAIFRKLGNKLAMGFVRSGLGDIYFWQGNYEQATKIYEESLAFAQDIGDRFWIACNIYNEGFIAWMRGDYIRATQKITDSLNSFHIIGHDWLAASSLHALGDITLAQGDDKSAFQWYEAELTFGQEAELHMSLALVYCGLGKVAWAQGDYELAAKRFEQGRGISRESDFKHGTFHALYGLGRVAQSQGDYATARAYYTDILEMQRQRISPLFKWNWLKTYVAAVAYPLTALAAVASAQNQMKRAARLLSAAESLYIPLRFEMSARERAEHDEAIAASRAALGEEAFATAWEAGKKMTLDEAVAYALQGTEANVG
jgi:tetratricopeptide (TPR) repeat protein